jgi:hypothetical protein
VRAGDALAHVEDAQALKGKSFFAHGYSSLRSGLRGRAACLLVNIRNTDVELFVVNIRNTDVERWRVDGLFPRQRLGQREGWFRGFAISDVIVWAGGGGSLAAGGLGRLFSGE